MPRPTDVADLVTTITQDMRAIISDEIALVKAELKPSVRRVGVGSGLFGAAGYFVVSATIVLWFTFAAGFAWLYAGTTRLSPWACVFLGTLTAVVLLLVIAGAFVFFGSKSFSKVHGPEKAPESFAKTFSAIMTGIEDGNDRVADEIQATPIRRP
ncbi:MAG: phage holin family protein [Propionibacteriaceae bacterium]|nr:phage holin family protein [Propionibacteriaceae bacterium]